MRIGMISTLGGGVGRITSYLIQGLTQNNNADIQLYQIDKRSEFDVSGWKNEVRYFRPRFSQNILSKLESLISISLMRHNCDLIHSHYSSYASILQKYQGPIILTMHGFPRPEIEGRFIEKIAYKFEKYSVGHIPENTKIITVSDYAKKEIERRHGVTPSVIYNGIDCNFFVPAQDKYRAKSRLGLQNKKIVLYVGRLHPIKDPMTLLRAFELVHKTIKESILVIAGTGSLLEQVLIYSHKKNIPVKYMEYVHGRDLLTLYQSADLFSLTSIGEALSTVLIEAMACRCPCIANTTGSSPEIVGMNELLVDPENPDSLAEHMIYVLENPSYSDTISEYLYNRARKIFSMDKMTAQYLDQYSRAVN